MSYWEYYDSINEQGEPVEVHFDKVLYLTSQNPEYSLLSKIEINFTTEADITGKEDGSSTLEKAGAALKKRIEDIPDCILAGYFIKRKNLSYFIYSDKPIELTDIANKFHSYFPAILINVFWLPDQEWKFYFERIYPDRAEYRTIEDRKLVEKYLEAGDDVSVPRKTEHTFLFETEEAQDEVKKELIRRGFGDIRTEYAGSSEGFCYKLVASKIHTLLKAELNDITTGMLNLADKYDSAYTGWSCRLR